ncbi:MAG: HNH endonuclease [Acidobacteriota bacterium]
MKPRQQGGKTVLANLAFACQGCNGYKHAKIGGYDFQTGKVVPLYNPRKQKWKKHFAWNGFDITYRIDGYGKSNNK